MDISGITRRKLAIPLKTILTRERLGLVLLLLTWLVFFSRILSTKFVYWLDDLKIIYYPLETVYATAQSAWQLPVWSNLFGFGQPLIAWGQLGFFTPLHFLLRPLLDPLNVLQVSVVFYFLLGLIGMYVFLRRHELSPAIAAAGGVLYVFSGFAVGHLNHVNFYTATMVLPWLLVAVSFFVARPTIRRATVIGVLIAIMMLSGQPQVGTYSVAIAAIYGLAALLVHQHRALKNPRSALKIVSLLLLAGFLAFALASFAILPLLEFLPLTERSGGLPRTVLYEFSYPPSHAITLVAPYFFGDHDNYWGAKGFQELAAFTGIVPLLLAGFGLANWRRHRELRIAGVSLLLMGILIALGRHSPLYVYLVESDVISSLSIPGRFVFFALTGLIFLAVAGFDDLVTDTSLRSRAWRLLPAIAVPITLLGSFVSTYQSIPRWADQAEHYLKATHPSIVLFAAGLALFIGSIFVRRRLVVELSLTILIVITLLSFAWNYNPVVAREQLIASSPLLDAEISSTEHIPPRLYSRPQLLSSRNSTKLTTTRPIGPSLKVWQPVPVFTSAPCYGLPLNASDDQSGAVQIGIHDNVTAEPLQSHILRSDEVRAGEHSRVCFTGLAANENQYSLSITSGEESGITLAVQQTPGERSLYVVRKESPTQEEIVASQKELLLDVVVYDEPTIDEEAILMARHLQAAAGMSSARWIGALTLKPYREFIEFFFANDREPIDGDNTHILTQHRELFDFAGVTHLAQTLPQGAVDHMSSAGFLQRAEATEHDSTYRLYENPDAYPKAFIVANARFEPAADEVRSGLLNRDFALDHTIFVSGPVPPTDQQLTSQTGEHEITIERYTDTEIVLSVNTTQPGWLVVTDASTPQWQSFIDGQEQAHYVANTLFKTVFVPGGDHEVAFRYHSPAIAQSKRLTLVGIGILIAANIPYRRFKKG